MKIDHDTLTDRAYAALKRALIAGEFPPGHSLVIRTVALEYGISATPVREALQRLVAERLLKLQPNRTIAVPFLSADRFEELSRIRIALEGLAAEMATALTDTTHLSNIEATVEEIDASVAARDIAAYAQLNQRLHFALYEQACAPLLLELIGDLWCRVGPFFTRLFDDPRYLPVANEHHRRLVAALRGKDASRVRRAVTDDISEAARVLTPQLAADPDAKGEVSTAPAVLDHRARRGG